MPVDIRLNNRNFLGIEEVQMPTVEGGTATFEEPKTIITKNITENGTYNASSDNADGYNEVVVNVSGGGSAFAPDFNIYMSNNNNEVMSFVGLDTSNMTNMGWILSNNNNVTELDLTGFVTSNAITMSGMCSGCSALQTLRLGIGFVTTNANVEGMFENCHDFTTIYYTGTTTQFYSNCGNMAQELAYNIGLGRTVTVHCSDNDITITGQERTIQPTLVGTFNNWNNADPDYTLTSNNDIYEKLNVGITVDGSGDYGFICLAFGAWDIIFNYNNTTFTNFPNNNDYSAYIDTSASSQHGDGNIIYTQGFVANVYYNPSTQTATVEYVNDIQ